ncbi:MAG: class I mannose-6-phosphate isomerase [Candidatus Aegiribacteria sp.]|nr:class I mannose-6-phosphate isomerase [Candidatus Aegiribacteria sp.]
MLYLSKPEYLRRIWGSLQKDGSETPVGEIWWLFHEKDHSSDLSDPVSGTVTSVDTLVSSGNLPGKTVYPILLKTLHTADRLSVQVHPGRDEGSLFKEETWIVLQAEAGAWMMGGINSDRHCFLESIRLGRAEEVLNRINLETGDIYHIPPGTVHSLGPGLEILEVQSSCNITYRLYDWGRTGTDGKPRQLHLEKGTEIIDWSSDGSPVPAGKHGVIDNHALDICNYSIHYYKSQSEVDVPRGGLFFLVSGSLHIQKIEIYSPACLIADMTGGVFRLEGSGYIVKPGGK